MLGVMHQQTTTPIRDQRLRRGWTQREAAEKCSERGASVTEAHFSRIERGMCMPYPRLRAVLAELFELDIDLQPKANA